MKHLRIALPIVLLVLLAACAPGTSSSSEPARPRIENFDPLFNLSINGKNVPYQDGAWVYETADYSLFTNFGSSVSFLGRERGAQGIAVSLVNKTQDRLAIVWDNTSFIDSDGSSSNVFHTGVRFVERNNPQAPTVVPPNARVDDEILPSDFTIDGGSDWITLSIVDSELAPDAGATFRYYLTLDVGGEMQNLDMAFTQKPPAGQAEN